MNYTLDNCAKTLLNVPFLSSIFWDEAVACTCTLYNLNSYQGNNFKIPIDLFFNNKYT